ncbi:MAG TPA: trypsin-like peptidase domain-containing protein, partial [Actinomycetota bacterium]|nr:trypsin-like peptidase domain-containing protein [Actinomycetota bacterium]
MRIRRSIAAGIAALVLGGCVQGSPTGELFVDLGTPTPEATIPHFDPGEDRIVQVVRRVRPAVVNVTTRFSTEESLVGGGGRGGGGTGFIVEPDGVIVTNYHVVEGALSIGVVTDDGERFDARVIGGDPAADLAVLDVEAEDLPTVPLGSSGDLELGQQVVAIGFALSLEGGPSVTSGIVSSLER